jgi:protein TonB
MFDRLIESDTSDFRPRSRYFIASSIVVGILFVSAVVISIYAAEIGLGSESFEISAIVAPVDPPATVPEPPKPRPQQAQQPEQQQIIRRDNIQRIEEPPVEAPPVSTEPSTAMTRPDVPFVIGNEDRGTSQPTGQATNAAPTVSEVIAPKQPEPAAPEPKPEPKPEPPKPAPLRSLGVVNGIATSLPKPPYPPTALMMNVQGKVDVQIMIDETGKVVSAKAVNGHPLLKQVSERAALNAKFKPTTLSDVPVKVTGVIVYNFTKN